ncbi:TIGR02206 family membrane protein [Propioniciclava soli]|uniref:TIGR02206 family membrane protein n=1 Tax=Propioniciclava soli TaxID=2775081 RepID=A0ABZ3C950_9ACTN
MGYFSAEPPEQPFRLFGPAHLAAIGVVSAGLCALRGARRLSPRGRRRVRTGLVAALWGQEVFYHGWRAATGRWTPQEMLPVHVCSVAVWGGGVGALTGNRALRDYAYYVGVMGATMAVLTPDLDRYGPRSVRFAQFFASHGLLVAVPVYLCVAEGYRPTWRGAGRTMALLALQGVVAHRINRAVGSNYVFVSRKPEFATALDALPPWPAYLPLMYAAAAAGVAALTVPFAGLPGRP